MNKDITENDLILKLKHELYIIDYDIADMENVIEETEKQINDKKVYLEKLKMKKSIYEDLIDTLKKG